ncbi:glutathione synthase [Marinomonas mediterranea]|jgi:glutathione synthase (EC 6.3.2.3)|uniref:Glutathione synthetase n=1 Tax=Marinomonas mediterranea (strain ATCC 700492 / JCM 21426 / NBRC 103028 / MMB-1) TaxID=717774 RepID=F2JZE3_MARM1|nr:glutathione synthase [Marinomonas mediterranea]ADZ93228.1 Glutathione synthetase [Marinomonas mediterranea MMB-1]WCN11116.1 glutathione synthase [Marinomonas mediterranea]WCN15179.1 glutathione synthase [Marinomonas mediterranea]WCN19223.1 glutathione synthase [Marinomonas mediterranea MMB-1]
MTIKLGIVMDPIQSITYKKDTSLAMLWAAADKGWDLIYMEQSDLFLQQGKAYAIAHPLTVFKDEESFYELGEEQSLALGDLDVILMRKDPPFDGEFMYSTMILEQAQRDGAMVVNNPASLRDCNEKLFATQFPQCCPEVLVTRRPDLLREFHKTHNDVIFKPLDGMGGTSIFRLKQDDPNVSVIIESLTEMGSRQIMAQKFIPEIKEGDKRILIVNGEPIPYALARIPASGETRGNLAAGGRGEGRPLSDRDRWICDQVIPTLLEKDLMFVGLDVIGDYLTEINVTSPTCVRELDNQFGLNIAKQLMDAIEDKLA